jgi:hypothetical protein
LASTTTSLPRKLISVERRQNLLELSGAGLLGPVFLKDHDNPWIEHWRVQAYILKISVYRQQHGVKLLRSRDHAGMG